MCALVAAMDELLKAGEPYDALTERVPYFLTALFQILSAVVDAQYPVVQPSKEEGKKSVVITPELRRVSSTPAALVSHALKSLLVRTRSDQIMDLMNAERG
ncbi:hypothetical protein L596_029242 [Steinernema carpocapsae]|uniref:Uncharacterized protein n=1 Tax=Steinernema carpocapsae TaxID=34508 RepID=A0A4U5LU27_STECR|nr:hypothetical protein L596_029242 [Steinernema carpocapsae]